jgi:hypothetical protein
MEPTNILPIAAMILLPTVAYGGWALLTALTGGRILIGELAGWQKNAWRAGHAHAGVLLVLSLVYLLYLPRAEFSNALEWVTGAVLLTGVAAQSGGFFLHMAVGEDGGPSLGTKVTRGGGLLIGTALIALAVGLIQTA